MTAATDTLTAIDLADALRKRPGDWARPFDLWLAADREAGDMTDDTLPRQIVRVERFRHAMIHAGFMLTKKGHPYKRCPQCRVTLSR